MFVYIYVYIYILMVIFFYMYWLYVFHATLFIWNIKDCARTYLCQGLRRGIRTDIRKHLRRRTWERGAPRVLRSSVMSVREDVL